MSEMPIEEKQGLFRRVILEWTRENFRSFPWRAKTDPYRTVITEKLLQQTDYGHVRKTYDYFFREFPTIQDLAGAPEEGIAKVLRPLGLWRQRTKQLKKMAEAVIIKHKGKLPSSYEELRQLPGIGDYSARATLCFAFGKPTYLLDVNTRKLVTRFFFHPQKAQDKEIVRVLEQVTPRTSEDCRVFNWGLIDFSNLVCSRKPKCKKCPLSLNCSYYSYLTYADQKANAIKD